MVIGWLLDGQDAWPACGSAHTTIGDRAHPSLRLHRRATPPPCRAATPRTDTHEREPPRGPGRHPATPAPGSAGRGNDVAATTSGHTAAIGRGSPGSHGDPRPATARARPDGRPAG